MHRPGTKGYRRLMAALQRQAWGTPPGSVERRAVAKLMLRGNLCTQGEILQLIRDNDHWNRLHPDDEIDIGELELLEELDRLKAAAARLRKILEGC